MFEAKAEQKALVDFHNDVIVFVLLIKTANTGRTGRSDESYPVLMNRRKK